MPYETGELEVDQGSSGEVQERDPFFHSWLLGVLAKVKEFFDLAKPALVPSGGTTGQVLAKASGDDYDTEWASDDAGSDDQTAAEVSYDNGVSGMTATDVQAALDELEARVAALEP